MPGVMWLPVSMSDVNNNAVGPSSLIETYCVFRPGPTAFMGTGIATAWQPHWASRPGTAGTGVRVSLGNALVLDWKTGLLYTTTSCVQNDAHHEHAAATWY